MAFLLFEVIVLLLFFLGKRNGITFDINNNTMILAIAILSAAEAIRSGVKK